MKYGINKFWGLWRMENSNAKVVSTHSTVPSRENFLDNIGIFVGGKKLRKNSLAISTLSSVGARAIWCRHLMSSFMKARLFSKVFVFNCLSFFCLQVSVRLQLNVLIWLCIYVYVFVFSSLYLCMCLYPCAFLYVSVIMSIYQCVIVLL